MTALIAAALLAVFFIELAAKTANVRRLSSDLPKEFESLFDAGRYRRVQDYTRARMKFDVAAGAYGLVTLFAFWFAGGFGWLDGRVRGLGWPEVPTGLVFVGLLVLGQSLLSLPFDVYSTFVIEERFGFNRTTWRTFISDRVKGLILTAVLGGVFLAAVLLFFLHTGPASWIYCWGAAVAFKFFVALAAPTWILPLFNKFTPLPEGELRTAIFEYARSVDYPLKNIFVMDGSKRSSKTNAFFTGFGKNKRIALFDTLIEKHTVPELVAVMAHEIGHYKMKHVMKDLVFSVFYYGVVFYLLSLFIRVPGIYEAFGVEGTPVYAGLVFFGIAYAPVSFLLSVGRMAISRRHEFEADRYSAETYDAESAVKALKTLSVSNLSNLTPHPLYVAIEYSHPPILKRIEALRAFSKK
jgi:STE24 endopeptidase